MVKFPFYTERVGDIVSARSFIAEKNIVITHSITGRTGRKSALLDYGKVW